MSSVVFRRNICYKCGTKILIFHLHVAYSIASAESSSSTYFPQVVSARSHFSLQLKILAYKTLYLSSSKIIAPVNST